MLKLGDVPNRLLVVGDDGYLFYRERTLLEPVEAERSAQLLARVFAAVDRCLAAHGTELIVVPLPRKSVVAGAKLPRYNERHLATPRSNAVPVWTDPATLGCLLAMAREATGFASLHCRESRRCGWVACGRKRTGERAMTWRGPTEVAALLSAIEVAP